MVLHSCLGPAISPQSLSVNPNFPDIPPNFRSILLLKSSKASSRDQPHFQRQHPHLKPSASGLKREAWQCVIISLSAIYLFHSSTSPSSISPHLLTHLSLHAGPATARLFSLTKPISHGRCSHCCYVWIAGFVGWTTCLGMVSATARNGALD